MNIYLTHIETFLFILQTHIHTSLLPYLFIHPSVHSHCRTYTHGVLQKLYISDIDTLFLCNKRRIAMRGLLCLFGGLQQTE